MTSTGGVGARRTAVVHSLEPSRRILAASRRHARTRTSEGAEVDIDAVIAKHGWALQAVLPDGPGVPASTYTVGLFDRLPELLCVGPPASVAGPTLDALAARLERRPELARIGQRIELHAQDAVPTVELGAVAPCWHELYVGRALAYHQRDDLELLQVLVPDGDGRFPDDPQLDPFVPTVQPILADPERPWRVPHGLRTLGHLAAQGVAIPHAVLLPIVDAGSTIGRDELVPAAPAGDGWLLLTQPSLADWCTADDVVAVRPLGEAIPGLAELAPELLDLEVARFERVVHPSARVALRWGACFDDDAGLDTLGRVLERPRFADVRLGLGAAPHALTFAAQPRAAEPLQIALRPLERDGYLAPRRLFHAHEDGDLAVPDPRCPHGQGCW
jgi:hypothetical protein